MKVLLTGAGGRLARAVATIAPAGWTLVRMQRVDLDVTDRSAVLEVIPAARPDVIVNLAAMTDVDACERDPDAAMLANADAVRFLAEAATRIDATLVQLSTSFVFDGSLDRPYVESDAVAPLGAYGRSKVAGEEAALAAPRASVVRTDALFGAGGSFADRALASLRTGATVTAIADRACSPTYVPDLAATLVRVIDARVTGVVHLAGTDACSWADLLTSAVHVGRLPGTVERGSVHDLDLLARRPRNSSLASERLTDLDVPPLPRLDDAVRRWVAAG